MPARSQPTMRGAHIGGLRATPLSSIGTGAVISEQGAKVESSEW